VRCAVIRALIVFFLFLLYVKNVTNIQTIELSDKTVSDPKKRLVLPSYLLWSYNKSKVCPIRMYKTIIEQVLERGSIKDIAEIIRFYGLKKVQDVALNVRVLNPKRVNLLSLIWDIPIEKFKAWNTRDWEKIYGGFLDKRNSPG